MNRAVYDDDKCRTIWANLITDAPYEWKLSNKGPQLSKAAVKLRAILQISTNDLQGLLSAEITVAVKLRDSLSAVLLGDDLGKAERAAEWIVSDWGGIRRGLTVVPIWINLLRPFEESNVLEFVRSFDTDRISSWSKVLAFIDHDKYAIFDSRTSLALNSAMVKARVGPQFFMPPRKSSRSDRAIAEIKVRSETLSGGFEEYLYLLRRFVELQLADSILDAERRIFAGADLTAQRMLESL